jgi:peptide/nickel transport system substrate-binding protein
MRRVSLAWLVPALLAMALVGAGCGGSDSGGSSSSKGSQTTGGAKVGEGKQGGNVTFLAAGDVDYLDPGQTYYTFGYMVQYAVNRTLYSFKPEDSSKPVPDLAEGEPQISSDNKTITVKIKKGVKFSPPVNREVTSKDIKYGIERAFTSNVPSGYATSYFLAYSSGTGTVIGMTSAAATRWATGLVSLMTSV